MCIIQRVMDIKIYKLVFCTMENTASQKLRRRCILAGAVDTICFASGSPPLLGQGMVCIRSISYVSVLYGNILSVFKGEYFHFWKALKNKTVSHTFP